MANKKVPDDKHKAFSEEVTNLPTFTLNGKTYTAKKTIEQVMTFGFMRKLRHLDELSSTYEMVEAMFDEDALEALDELTFEEAGGVIEQIYGKAGVTPGE
jgi:hypothetical protein